VRDASFLYEIDVRGGAPRKATRTASDGSYQSGERALASLLGVGAGRFVVTPSAGNVRGDLTGTLAEQLARPVAAARGALSATTGAATMYIERIVLDRDTLEEYLRTTPDPARTLVRRIAEGTSPRQMLLGGDVSPALLEDILADVAARGAVRSVEGAGGSDLLTPAVDAALAVIRGATRPPSVLPPNARPSAPSLAPSMRGTRPADVTVKVPTPTPAPSVPSSPPLAASPSPPPAYVAFKLSEPPPPPPPDEDPGVPSSLEDAVMRQLSERSPFPGATHGLPPPIVEPSELRPRSSNPPAADEDGDSRPLPSIPPDAIVPDTSGGDSPSGETLAASSHDEAASAPRPAAGVSPGPPPKASDGGASARPKDASSTAPAPSEPAEGAYAAPFSVTAPAPVFAKPPAPVAETALAKVAAPIPRSAIATVPPKVPRPAAGVRSRAPSSRSVWPGLLLAFGVLGAAVAIVLYFSQGDSGPAARPPVPSAVAVPPLPPAATHPPAPPTNPPAATPPTPAVVAETGDLPPGAEVPTGYGLLEIAAPPGARIRVDGALIGNGGDVRTALPPGAHDVAVEVGGRESRESIDVHAGKATRARVAPPP
jgi:hypothetical protein